MIIPRLSSLPLFALKESSRTKYITDLGRLELLDADEGVLLELLPPAVALGGRLGHLPLHLLPLLDLVVAVALHAVVLVLQGAEPVSGSTWTVT